MIRSGRVVADEVDDERAAAPRSAALTSASLKAERRVLGAADLGRAACLARRGSPRSPPRCGRSCRGRRASRGTSRPRGPPDEARERAAAEDLEVVRVCADGENVSRALQPGEVEEPLLDLPGARAGRRRVPPPRRRAARGRSAAAPARARGCGARAARAGSRPHARRRRRRSRCDGLRTTIADAMPRASRSSISSSTSVAAGSPCAAPRRPPRRRSRPGRRRRARAARSWRRVQPPLAGGRRGRTRSHPLRARTGPGRHSARRRRRAAGTRSRPAAPLAPR